MKDMKEHRTRLITVALILVFLAFISMFSAGIIGIFVLFAGGTDVTDGNVAVIAIKGPILADDSAGVFSNEVTSSSSLRELITLADEDPDIKAILFEINSPGGTAVASYEIAEAIKSVNKTTVAWIREVGASGAYWAATATDHIVASPLSATGSIGVLASYLDFSGFINRYNISYQRLVSGKYKDAGTPFRELTEEEESIIQGELDMIHDVFIKEVAANRNLSYDAISELATGRIYLGTSAYQLGLIDEVGTKEDAISFIEEAEGIEAELAVFERPTTLADVFGGVIADQSFFVGKGIGSALSEKRLTSSLEILT